MFPPGIAGAHNEFKLQGGSQKHAMGDVISFRAGFFARDFHFSLCIHITNTNDGHICIRGGCELLHRVLIYIYIYQVDALLYTWGIDLNEQDATEWLFVHVFVLLLQG